MIQNSQMTRWTRPTNPEFYALHKEAIEFYTTIAAIAQGIWLIFSVKPLAELLAGQLDWLSQNTSYCAAVGVLIFLHWQLHKLLKYIAFNWLDKDPNTNSSFMHYGLALVITGGMLALDIQGTKAFFREDDKFEGLTATNDAAKDKESVARQSRYEQDIATLSKSEQAEIAAIKKSYAPKIAAVKSRKTFDTWDVNKKSRDLKDVETKRDADIAAVETSYAQDAKALLSAKNGDLANIGNNHTNRHQRILKADDDNAAKSSTYGWVISCVCLLVLLGCTYQVTDLRVHSGQQPIARITIADETGSFGSKLHDALTDIAQRYGHILVYNIHNTLAVKELDELDGSYQIKGRTNASAPTPPTTPPLSSNPTPPTNPPSGGNGGGNGGNGGGHTPSGPTPSPTHGAAKPQQVEQNADVAVATRRNLLFSEMGGADQFAILEEIHKSNGRKMSHLLKAFHAIDPEMKYIANLGFVPNDADWQRIVDMCADYEKEESAVVATPAPSVVAAVIATPVAQPTFTVAQQKEPKNTELDDKLNLLKSKLRKEGRSNFDNSQANNESVRNRICRILDEASLALIAKGAKCTPSVLADFYKVANEKIELIAEFGATPYGAIEDFNSIVKNRLGEEVDNG